MIFSLDLLGNIRINATDYDNFVAVSAEPAMIPPHISEEVLDSFLTMSLVLTPGYK